MLKKDGMRSVRYERPTAYFGDDPWRETWQPEGHHPERNPAKQRNCGAK